MAGDPEDWNVLFHEHGISFAQKSHSLMAAEADQLAEIKDAVAEARSGNHDSLVYSLTDQGFFPETAEFLVHCILGREPPRQASLMEFWRGRLEQIKKEMRARGECSRIHEEAVAALEHEHQERIAFIKRESPNHRLPDFDRQKFENFYRRSQRPRGRAKKSRAK